jgi:hypothetical protein
MNNIDDISRKILVSSGIIFHDNNEILIPRDSLLSDTLYNEMKPELVELKKY